MFVNRENRVLRWFRGCLYLLIAIEANTKRQPSKMIGLEFFGFE